MIKNVFKSLIGFIQVKRFKVQAGKKCIYWSEMCDKR